MSNLKVEEMQESLIKRVEVLVRVAWALIAGTFVVGAWAAKITYDNEAQWTAINRQEQELARRREWMEETSDRMTRVEEKLILLVEISKQNNELLQGKR